MQREKISLILIVAFAFGILLVAPFLGVYTIRPADVIQGTLSDTHLRILTTIRIPRVLTTFLAGAGLSICGLAFQTMFRNPLATPYTLGVASGASLGSALYIRFGLSFGLLALDGITLFAFLGALLSIMFVYAVSRLRQTFTSATMLLAGISISFCFSSLILFIQYISKIMHSFSIIRWLMGSVAVTGYNSFWNLMIFLIPCSIFLFTQMRELNLLLTGEDLASSRGVNVNSMKKRLFLITSLMVGAIVAQCGPIAFVGMMVPHICRLLGSNRHGYLLPASFLFGGTFLVLCDLLARTLIAPAEIPVGVITSLLGGPFFLWLLIQKKRVL